MYRLSEAQASASKTSEAGLLTPCVPEHDAAVLLAGCAEEVGVGGVPRHVVDIIRVAAREEGGVLLFHLDA